MGMTRSARTAGAVLTVALVVAGAAACEGGKDAGRKTGATSAASTPPQPFGTGGYRGLRLSMTKDEALASGALEPSPVSLLNGCTDYAYKGGPAPDPVRMAAETEARAKSDKAIARIDEMRANRKPFETLAPGASPEEMVKHSERLQERLKQEAAERQESDALFKEADVIVTARKNRDQAFLATGRVNFGTEGLRQLVAPADARTAEGVGAGSAEDEPRASLRGQGPQADRGRQVRTPGRGRQRRPGLVLRVHHGRGQGRRPRPGQAQHVLLLRNRL